MKKPVVFNALLLIALIGAVVSKQMRLETAERASFRIGASELLPSLSFPARRPALSPRIESETKPVPVAPPAPSKRKSLGRRAPLPA